MAEHRQTFAIETQNLRSYFILGWVLPESVCSRPG